MQIKYTELLSENEKVKTFQLSFISLIYLWQRVQKFNRVPATDLFLQQLILSALFLFRLMLRKTIARFVKVANEYTKKLKTEYRFEKARSVTIT